MKEGYQSWFLHGQIVNLTVRPVRTGTSPPKVGPSAWPHSLPPIAEQGKTKACPHSVMSSTGCRHCFFDFKGWVSGIPMVRFIIYIVSVPRDSEPRFGPPGYQPGTLSPGSAPVPGSVLRSALGSGSGSVPLPCWAPDLGPCLDRVRRGGALRIIFRFELDRLQRWDAPGKFPGKAVDYSWITA